MTITRKPLILRMEAKTLKQPSDCWEWEGSLLKGYGRIREGGRGGMTLLTHRASYMIFKGEITEGFNVLHTCDNPKCWNPKHLFLGTNKDNSKDMVLKGRQAKGVENGRCKLTDAEVLAIRSEFATSRTSHRKLALQYHVSHTVIGGIVRNKTWKHVVNFKLA